MRLLTRHIYRAFPELDPYPDDRCERFLHAAQRGRLRRALHWALILAAGGMPLAGGVALSLWLMTGWYYGYDEEPFGLAVTLLLAGIIAAPLAGFLARDLLLRLRVRGVLRRRGVCPSCGYSLVGLPVAASNVITCPECSLDTEVDPAMDELVLDESGRPRFHPPPARVRRLVSPAVMRRVIRWSAAAALLLCIAAASIAGLYEFSLRRDAALARAERPGAAAILALIEANQPPLSEGAPNAWDAFDEVLALQQQAAAADDAENPRAGGDFLVPDFSRIYTAGPDNDDFSRQYGPASEAYARRLLEVYRRHGVYDAMDRMAAAPRALRPLLFGPDEPAYELHLPELGQASELSAVNAARMFLAQERGDPDEYVSALEANLALARMISYHPLLISEVVANAREVMVYTRLKALLATHPPPDWLDAIDAAIARQSSRPPPSYAWEGERLAAMDTLAWVFSDPARVRWGAKSLSEASHLFTDFEGRVGGYRGNRDALNARSEAILALARQRPWERTPPPPLDEPVLWQYLAGSPKMALRSRDTIKVERAGYIIMAALERHRAAAGAYPDSLSALVPAFLDALPPDPLGGESWGYRRGRPTEHPEDPREYILYSYGDDRLDNRGRHAPMVYMWGPSPERAGFDYALNEWTPRPAIEPEAEEEDEGN